ncbi:putative short-chain dehydrogenase, partial [Periconia macrospinosa]
FPSFTTLSHNSPYPSISPTRPSFSTTSKTIVITGGGSGIGAGIAQAFALAGSTKIAIISRTESKLLNTKHTIETKFPQAQILAVPADITNPQQINSAFAQIYDTFGPIHVLVANSASMPPPSAIASPTFDAHGWWDAFGTNVLGALNTVTAFAKYAAHEGAQVLNISTAVAHMPALEPGVSAYAASKLAAAKMFEYVALENPGWNVVNVHPGLVDTELSRTAGHGGVDHVDLPGHFCVWLVSPEAQFLRGKFVWTNWDVDELMARKEEILGSDVLDLKLGGVSF